MSEYYGVQRSDDYLAHYGIKGMRWGVQKAKESGNSARLARHYQRSAKKLQTLTARSDKDLVNSARKENVKQTFVSTLTGGLASGGLIYGLNSHLPAAERLKYSAIVGGVGAGVNALAGGIDAIRLRRMASKSGNAKQNAKRIAFEKQMRESFKGTPYAKRIDKTKANIRKSITIAKRAANPYKAYEEEYYRQKDNKKRGRST